MNAKLAILGRIKASKEFVAAGTITEYGIRRLEGLRFAAEAIDQDPLLSSAPDLLAACEAALYLLGNDADRAAIGDRPWLPHSDNHVPYMLRAAIDKATGGKP